MSRSLRVGVLDLVTNAPTQAMWARVMFPNMTGVMPQAVAAWCARQGHQVRYIAFTGSKDLIDDLPADLDLLFISAFTRSAQLAAAISAVARSNGTVTVLGGPHGRCYPEDARRWFDVVVEHCDESIIQTICADPTPSRPLGRRLSARRLPGFLPTLEERWQFVGPVLERAPFLKIIPALSSVGCPYACGFCIDAATDYCAMDLDQVRADLVFAQTLYKRPIVAWHDPNFGVRFDEIISLIEETCPSGVVRHIAESTLSLLRTDRLRRLKKNGFVAALPGIETWNGLGYKTATGRSLGEDKVRQVAEHCNEIMEYIPFLQSNFVLGMDSDEGATPFELTASFLDQCPGAFPAYSMLSAFGEAAEGNREYQRQGRLLPFPFHFLNNNTAMNIRPKNYTWPEFYRNVIWLMKKSFSKRAIARRFKANDLLTIRSLNLVRAISTEGWGRIRQYEAILDQLETDKAFRDYFEGQTETLPRFYLDLVERDLGPFWEHLPQGALYHNHRVYEEKQVG